MIVAEDYKRASRMAGAVDHAVQLDTAVSASVLRLAWGLSRIAAVPTPDLAQQLANALIEVSGPDRAVAVQMGCQDASGRWRAESSGVAGRLGSSLPTEFETNSTLPWPRTPESDGEPTFLVREPARGEPSMRSIEESLQRVNLGVEFAAAAWPGIGGRIVLTAQFGGTRDGHTRARASLLARVLPWAYHIARAALGEGEGLEPRCWLTEKERVVLERIVHGESVIEIARAIGRSHYTVHDHVKSLHRKLGVHTRAALVGCATLGVPPPDFLKEPAFDRLRD